MFKDNKDWEKEFDSIFTINFFSSENYKGQVDEYEFTRWQREQTNNANLRVVALKSFISQALEAQKKEIVAFILENVDDDTREDLESYKFIQYLSSKDK